MNVSKNAMKEIKKSYKKLAILISSFDRNKDNKEEAEKKIYFIYINNIYKKLMFL